MKKPIHYKMNFTGKMKEIKDIKEVQSYLLGIAKVAKQILSAHNIPFVLAYGSLLGAVRHKGFIPWDDDMDFYIPYEKYYETLEVLSKELPEPYKVHFYKRDEKHTVPFIKIEDSRTIVDDKNQFGDILSKTGLSIDLFPVVSVDSNSPLIRKLWKLRRVYRIVYNRDVFQRKLVVAVKFILRNIWMKSRHSYLDEMYGIVNNMQKGNAYFSVFGDLDDREIMKKEWIDNLSKYKFEDTEFEGIKDYDAYLSRYFGDYMKLPPVENQKSHSEGVFIKSDK